MKVVIIGAGYVGLVAAACFAEVGHDVVCVDVSASKVDQINKGQLPIHEPGLDELLANAIGSGRLRATTNLADAMAGAAVTMIAVGTPFDGRNIDLTYVREAASAIGEVLRDSAEYHVVCVKSTVVPGTTETVVGRAVAEASGRSIGDDIGLAMNPEFTAEGTAVSDFMNPDRIVIGANDSRAADRIRELYAPFAGTDVVVTNPATAEMIKYAANSYLATVISFSNEIANLSAAVGGVDAIDVMKGVHLDRRLSPILPQGRVRPGVLSFLLPGTGFGGSCFPKDVNALIAFGEALGSPMRVLRAVMDTNAGQPDVTVDLCRAELGGLGGKRIAVLGLAFKPGTDDVRESPAARIIRALAEEGARVVAHDPLAIENMKAALAGVPAEYTGSLSDAVRGADAIVLLTSWPEYRDLVALVGADDVPVIDGRRFLDPASFARYRGIGLRPARPA